MLTAALDAGLHALGQDDLSATQRQALLDYLGLLSHWNRAYNLTAVREPEAMVSRHLLDSLSVRPFLCGQRILDVGTGAGLPGIPLAVAEPSRQFILLDSLGKRMVFLRQVLLALKLDNVTLVQSRVQDYQPTVKPDGVISRAFANLGEFATATRHLFHEHSCGLAMKGQGAGQELLAWQATGGAADVSAELLPLRVPGAQEQRFLLRWRYVKN